MNGTQRLFTIITVIALITITCTSLAFGKYHIDIDIILKLLLSKIKLLGQDIGTQEQKLILFNVRLPRVILVSFVGAGLAVSGAVLQSVFKNPLVSPFILGVSSGASLGVSLVIVLFQTYNNLFLQSSAFIFASLAVLSVIFISKLISNHNIVVLALSGIIVSTFLTSLVSLLQYFSEEQKMESILFWTFGSFRNASWENLQFICPITLICAVVLVAMSWKINILSLGNEESQILGLNSRKFSIELIAITTLLTSSATAVCGPIGWVGLLIPHIVRSLGGANNFFVIVNSLLLGASFLQLVDMIARNLASVEIPVGIVTAIIGLPFFTVLLAKSKFSL